MDTLVPPAPTAAVRAYAGRLAAMRVAGTEKGILVNLETKRRGAEVSGSTVGCRWIGGSSQLLIRILRLVAARV